MIKYGSYREYQRYRCKNCGRTFNDKTDTIFAHAKIGHEKLLFAFFSLLWFNTLDVRIASAQPQAIMRFDADWMSRADDRILEHLSEAGPDTPKEMADSDRVRFSRQHINARCKTLVTYDLLVHLVNGVYDITRQGEQYLAGELDARDLEAA